MEEALTIQTDTQDAQPDIETQAAETVTAVDASANGHMIRKSRFDETNNQLKELKAQQEAQTKAQTEAERKALIEQNKFKELYEAEQAEKAAALEKAQALELSIIKRDVAATLNVPSGLISRIMGSTREEIEADAKALMAALPKSTAPSLDSKAGGGKAGNPGVTDGEIQEMAAQMGVSAEYLKKQLGA